MQHATALDDSGVTITVVDLPEETWRDLSEPYSSSPRPDPLWAKYKFDEHCEMELGLTFEFEPRRSIRTALGLELTPGILLDVLAAAVSTGFVAGAYKLLKTWVDARNGRKLKIKVGDIEVEATQMKEEDVLRIFELLQEKADRKKIRELLLEAGKDGGRPEVR